MRVLSVQPSSSRTSPLHGSDGSNLLTSCHPTSCHLNSIQQHFQPHCHTHTAMPSCHPHTLAYHSFSDVEVDAIRSHLLAWYRANRRRLPWRGDPPPYGAAAKQQHIQPHNSNDNNNTATSSTTPNTLSRYFTPLSSSSPASPINKRPKPSPPSTASAAPPTGVSRVPVSAYGVWVSEVMLQQTRVETVIAYYTRWMTLFPTIAQLATATADDVNTAWSGLGYYRRARLLHEAAKHVQSKMKGQLPDTVSGLLSIPGIGPYTAGAIASIAFNRPVPLVDGNVSRVLSRLRALHASPKDTAAIKLHWQLAQQLATGSSGSERSTDASDWNQALMELGAVVCMPRVAECGRCPVRQWCRAAEEVAERRRPVGEQQWRVNRRKVEVEVDLEERDIDRDGNVSRKASVAKEEEREEHKMKQESATTASHTKQRRGSGRVSVKQSKQTLNGIVLDDTPCSICDPQAAAPTAVVAYPSKADKKPPTDEHVSVCVVSRRRVRGDEVEWLLVQRPADGLLAGQWEFPSVVHSPPSTPSASSSSTPRAPTAAQRRQVLSDGLAVVLPVSLAAVVVSSAREVVGELIHVFSHRRHLMQVQRCVVEEQADDTTAVEGESSDGRRWRWMTESEITAIGLTTGQRKVWALSRGAKVRLTAGGKRDTERKKRKDVAEGEQEQSEDCRDADGEECDEEIEEEWEVWPTNAVSDEAVVEADGFIVID